VGIYFINKI